MQEAIATGNYRISLHARVEAYAENINLAEIKQAIANGSILEDYLEDKRGHSCLVYGQTAEGRSIHIVVSVWQTPVTIITVYEPKPPKWITPVMRGGE